MQVLEGRTCESIKRRGKAEINAPRGQAGNIGERRQGGGGGGGGGTTRRSRHCDKPESLMQESRPIPGTHCSGHARGQWASLESRSCGYPNRIGKD